MKKKELSQTIASAVDSALAAGLPRAAIIDQVTAMTGCTARTIYRHLRRSTPIGANWGGRRPNAGRPRQKSRRLKGLTSVTP